MVYLMADIDIVIPTYQRGDSVVATVGYLQNQTVKAERIIIVDQTPYPDGDSNAEQLQQWHDNGVIHWLRLSQPSIPVAMNRGLLASTASYVLFLDDDIEPSESLIEAHLQAVCDKQIVATVGQILQPGESPVALESADYGTGFAADLSFPFNSAEDRLIRNCMAGNLVVDRQAAIACGGFDTNFVGSAYRFETEFCRRLLDHSGLACQFVAEASIHHLRCERGGTRAKVPNFLTSASAHHSVGEYYFVLRHAQGGTRLRYIAKRLLGAPVSRFYLRQPWWIIPRLVGECNGLIQAAMRFASGPRLLEGEYDAS